MATAKKPAKKEVENPKEKEEVKKINLQLNVGHYQEYFKKYPERQVYLHNIIMEQYMIDQHDELTALKAEKKKP